ncbi:peptide-methionine (S)-S-oxide reductase MsrA [Paenibacillus albicereus]|uniref:Peptide methionine sulfoxide reductase MsrA n=2 Tax=Paenibacillus albicereus TaxID=2726185 RepID=A0A6H2H3A6_9BACL|nr:peptide-methionine (S)-S-oxide reductase MsrA [Paenibacillus albicereus]
MPVGTSGPEGPGASLAVGSGEAEGGDAAIGVATFAGGCFWCMVEPFEQLPGIRSVTSGYTGGWTDDPTYEQVASETTGHAEAVRIEHDPRLFPYERLLDLFWRQIDPTDAGGQFQDRGASYRTAIFVHDERQRELAEASRRALERSGRFKGRIATEIVPAGPFYPAEEEHQQVHRRRFGHYRLYRQASGRDEFLRRHWDREPDRKRLESLLTEEQRRVALERRPEPAHAHAGGDGSEEGLYVDLLTGDPLFGTRDQFDAGDGWPAFRRPLHDGLIVREAELGSGPPRTALLSRLSGLFLGYALREADADGHGGHYRVYASAVRFVPRSRLAEEGYAGQLALWEEGH